ncbi:MAG: right-handed parallel beta-helix repeat-containing protein, partial [Armatimonadota bacterium]
MSTIARLAIVVCVLLAVSAFAQDHDLKLYVSPGGSDTAAGTQKAPFATLARAREEVRKLKAAGALTGSLDVSVKGGRYLLPETLALGPEDSGTAENRITWRAVAGDTVLLAGAKAISGFKPWKGSILQADLKGTPLEKLVFRQLFYKGARQVMARYPNFDPKDPHQGGWANVLRVESPTQSQFYYTSDVEKNWTNVQYASVGIHPNFDWGWSVVGIKSVDRAQEKITLAGNTAYEIKVGDRYYVQNLLEELDAPGEWYLDRDKGTLYFWPPADAAGKAPAPSEIDNLVTAPVLQSVVTLKGANNVTVRGFTIEACDGEAVQISGCENAIVGGCTIRNCGSWAVTIDGGHDSGAYGNDIYATGAGGISVNGGDRKTLEAAGNYATNNYIHHIALFAKTYNTGINLSGVGNKADHNLIHDTYHAGMALSGNDNVMEYNLIHHTNLGSNDTGGVYYCSRDWTMRGNQIRYNIFHHCGGFGKDNSWSPVQNGKVTFSYPQFTWGIYLDDPTSGTTVYGNILYAVPICGLHNHGGRDNTWENNIVIDAPAVNAGMLWDGWDCYPDIIQKLKDVQYAGSPYLKKYPELAQYDIVHPAGMSGLKFVRNIFYYTENGSKWLREKNKGGWQGGQLLYSYSVDPEAFKGNQWDYNTIYAPQGVDLKISLNRQPDGQRWLGLTDWQGLGMDTHSSFADPLFVNPAKNDYRLRPDSPALKLGFKQIPVNDIGLQKSDLRATWPVVEAVGASALGEFTTYREFKLPGYDRVKAEEFVPREGLPNFAAKLLAKQPVKVAYYGGGIHYGGWRAAMLDDLRKRGAEVTEIDASICDCVRGSGFSAYRFAHDVLAKKPDLVLVDFASDDQTTGADEIWAAVEGVVRQARKANPKLDILFLYAFRAGYETDFAEGLSPMTISAYERVADHYDIPSVNMAYRVAQLARDGKLLIKATPEEATAQKDKLVFSNNGTMPAAGGNQVYAATIADAMALLTAVAGSLEHKL